VHKAPDSARSVDSYVTRIDSLEAVVQKLEQENKDLEAQIELYEENKELATKVNNGKISQLEAEINGLALWNYSMKYKDRQSEVNPAQECKKREESEVRARQSLLDTQKLSAKDEQLAEARVRIAELESSSVKLGSDGSTRFAQLY
jgi:exonuclease VII small subunit